MSVVNHTASVVRDRAAAVAADADAGDATEEDVVVVVEEGAAAGDVMDVGYVDAAVVGVDNDAGVGSGRRGGPSFFSGPPLRMPSCYSNKTILILGSTANYNHYLIIYSKLCEIKMKV